jgi:hypothetical protein
VTIGVKAVAPKTLSYTGGSTEVLTWNTTIHTEDAVINSCVQSPKVSRSVVLHWVTSCNQCGINWCDRSKWAKDKVGVEGGHHVAETLTMGLLEGVEQQCGLEERRKWRNLRC